MANFQIKSSIAALYVGDLHVDVTDSQLFEVFSRVGEIESIRVCRDSITGRSLCYGYVNYKNRETATRAIKELSHVQLNGKQIRIMWSRRDPDARRSGIGNIFVKNLAESITSIQLQKMFAQFGYISSCKVASQDGKSKCFGFIQFDTQESANAAIKALNNTIIEGKQIYVGNFIRKRERVILNPDAKYTNLYVKNLDIDITEEVLREKFSEFGKITNLTISRDLNGNSKGFGFVNFENSDHAKWALEVMNEKQLGTKIIYVGRAQKRAERGRILRRQFEERRNAQILKYKNSNVYVKNLDNDIDDDMLRKHFSEYGTITSAKVMRDVKGMSKGFGFVCFSTPEEANAAVGALKGTLFHGKPLYLNIAQKKEDRRAQLNLKFSPIMRAPTSNFPTPSPHFNHMSSVNAPFLPQQRFVYQQPLSVRTGWRIGAFPNPPGPVPSFQHMPQVPVVPNTTRQNRQRRGRINGQMLPQGGHSTPTMMPNLQMQTTNSLKDAVTHQQAMQHVYLSNDQPQMNGYIAPPPIPHNKLGVLSNDTDTLSSMLSVASPEQHKLILGDFLYPLVRNLRDDFASKITGMLLEMDDSEILLLIDSPDSLAAKVEEAVEVLKLAKTKAVSAQDTLPSGYLSTDVAMN